MIIFYDKKTGDITGTISGRIHTPEQKEMWIGDRNTTDRIIYELFERDDGSLEFTGELEETEKDFLLEVEKTSGSLIDYRIDTLRGKVKKKDSKEIALRKSLDRAQERIRESRKGETSFSNPFKAIIDLQKKVKDLEETLGKLETKYNNLGKGDII